MYATNVAVPLKGGALRDVSLALLSSELAKKLLMLGAEELEAPSVRWRRGGVRRFCSRSITRQRLDSGGAALCALRGVLPSGDEASQGGWNARYGGALCSPASLSSADVDTTTFQWQPRGLITQIRNLRLSWQPRAIAGLDGHWCRWRAI